MLSLLRPTIYIQLSPDRVTLRDARSGQAISEAPVLAVDGRGKIVAVGAAARALPAGSGATVLEPFGHPRSLVSDFTAAQSLLKALLRRLPGRSIVAPVIVMHPLGDPAGGFTQIETTALAELARGAGASRVVVWQGPALSDRELMARTYPDGGRVLR